MPVMREFERANTTAQASRFKTVFYRTAASYLRHVAQGGTPSPEEMVNAARVAAEWNVKAYGSKMTDAMDYTHLAARIVEHPELFRPEGLSVDHQRMRAVAVSVANHARAIGRHLVARAEAKADAQGLVERLREALCQAQGALAYLEAADGLRVPPAHVPRPRFEALMDNALACYQEAQRVAAGGPSRLHPPQGEV